MKIAEQVNRPENKAPVSPTVVISWPVRNNPFIGVASMGYEGNPCNTNLDNLALIVKDNIKRYDMNPFKFNTIGVSDGISMGTHGMRYSLPSRELIAKMKTP